MLLDFLERGLRTSAASVEEWVDQLPNDPIHSLEWVPLRQMVKREAFRTLLKTYGKKGSEVVVDVVVREARRRAVSGSKCTDLIWVAIRAEEISVWAELACDIEAIAAEDEETA